METKTSSIIKSFLKGITVTLPACHEPIFPEKCVVCNKQCSDSYANIGIEAGTDYGFRYFFSFKKVGSKRVPTHAECRLKSMLYSIPVWAFMLSTGLVTYWMKKEHILHGIRGFTILAGLCLLIALVVSLYSGTRGISVEKKHDRLRYCFADSEYAREFAELNNTAVDG